VPVHLLSGGIDVELSPVLRFSAWANAQSNYELDASNSHGSFGAQRLLNAELAWQAAPRLELSLQVKNLGNDHYEYVWWDGVQSLHSRGDERAAYASARFRL
jgi:iron complex outermembrane receptor protein